MGRPPCCDKSNVKRGMWTAEEDAKILAYVSTHGTGNWTSVPKKAGLKRCGKSCRLRWTNYLRPDLKHESFTPQEENLIVSLHAAIGSRWSLIADQLPGRTDNDVKNYWNTKLRKKLFEMGIDPVTHKPFSQILADYGSIGGLPKAGIRIGSLNRDLRNAFMVKTEASPVPKETISNITRHSMKAISTPKMEPIQDGLVDSYNNNYSWELLGQLQAIKLVKEASNFTNQENIQAHFFIEGSSSSSSSSNAIQVTSPPPFPCQQPPQLQPTPSSPFSWSEFLQEDAFLPVDPQQQEDFQGLSSTGSSSQMQLQDDIQQRQLSDGGNNIFSVVQDVGYDGYHDIGQGYPGTVRGEASNVIGASSSSDDSFVEGILDGDSEMSWEFPNILDEPFY